MNEKTVNKAIKQMQNKKSSGEDGHTQNQLKLGADSLTNPMTAIINKSINWRTLFTSFDIDQEGTFGILIMDMKGIKVSAMQIKSE